MSQIDWQNPTFPLGLLILIKDLATDRKLRLLCCACTRRIWHLLAVSGPARRAVNYGEEYADGVRTDDEMATILKEADAAIDGVDVHQEVNALRAAAWCVNSSMDALSVARAALASAVLGSNEKEQDEEKAQIALIWDIFDGQVKNKLLDPSRRTSTVVALARQMYDSRDFGSMPILADALKDAGCSDADILAHCHSGGPHVRGCWVVDLVLGKQ